jgi:hypothetical protein
LIDALYADTVVGIRLDIGSGSVAIPADPNHKTALYSSAESLRIPDCIDVIHAADFRFRPNLRELIARSGKSAAFTTVECLSAWSSLHHLKSSEGTLAEQTRMKVAEASGRGGRAERFFWRPETSHGSGKGGKDARFSSAGKATGKATGKAQKSKRSGRLLFAGSFLT